MFPGNPSIDEIKCTSLSATGNLVTVPAGKWYTGTVSLTAAITVAGTCNPQVVVNGAGGAPTAGTVVARLNTTGLALTALSDTGTTDILVKAGANPLTIDFTAGTNGASTVTINGYIMG